MPFTDPDPVPLAGAAVDDDVSILVLFTGGASSSSNCACLALLLRGGRCVEDMLKVCSGERVITAVMEGGEAADIAV